MEEIACALMAGLTERGWGVEVVSIDPLDARLMIHDAALTGQDCELDILKEAFTLPPDATPYGPDFVEDEEENWS